MTKVLAFGKKNIATIVTGVAVVVIGGMTLQSYTEKKEQNKYVRQLPYELRDMKRDDSICSARIGEQGRSMQKQIDNLRDSLVSVNSDLLRTVNEIQEGQKVTNIVLTQLCNKIDGMNNLVPFLKKEKETTNK